MVAAPPLLYTDPKTGELRRRRWTLTVMEGADQGATLELDQSPVLIGAAPAAALVLSDDTVSRYHLELDVFAEGIRLRDLDSTNGTFVGQARIRDAFIESGETFRLGRTVVRADSVSEPAAPEIDTDPLGIPLGGVERIGEALAVSATARSLFEDLRKVAQSPSTVLLEGEPGSGKATAAILLHKMSPRKQHTWFAVRIEDGLPEEAQDELLFGANGGSDPTAEHLRIGAFERANGGTLFLEAVDRLHPIVQRRLLRAIESGEIQRSGDLRRRRIDVRLVAATSSPDASKTLDSRLLRRLAVVRMRVPPLRERTEDLTHLARKFLEDAGRAQEIGPRLALRLEADPWPGNLDQLKAAMGDLVLPAAWIAPKQIEPRPPLQGDLRRAFVADLLAGESGSVTRAAKKLQVAQRALFRYLTHEAVDVDAS